MCRRVSGFFKEFPARHYSLFHAPRLNSVQLPYRSCWRSVPMRLRFWLVSGTFTAFLWSALVLPGPNAAREAGSPARARPGERDSSDTTSRLSLRFAAGKTETIPFDPPVEPEPALP